MSTSENAALIRSYIESVKAMERGDQEAIERHGRFYHPDIVCEWNGRSPFAGTFTGPSFGQWTSRWAPYDVTIVEVIDVLASDDRVALLVVEDYEHRESGEVLRVDRVALYGIEDGMIKSMTVRDEDQYASDEFWTRTAV
jgi:ketosteroid isomerase-like protein